MTSASLENLAPDGEDLRYVDHLRGGGRVGLTDERLLVLDGEPVSVDLSAVEAVEFEAFDWFLAILGFILAGIGLYGARETPLVGLFFVAVALVSLAYTYRKRSTVTVRLHSRAKPVTVHPVDGEAFMDAFRDTLEAYRARHDLDPADV